MTVSLVSALENHISGFSSVSDDDYAATSFQGPFLNSSENLEMEGMTRANAESSKSVSYTHLTLPTKRIV